MKIAAILSMLLLAACDDSLAAHLEAERDFHANQNYQQDIAYRRAFRPEVYADDEFVADCEEYEMSECFQ